MPTKRHMCKFMTAPKWKTTDPKVHPQVPGEPKGAVHPGDTTRHTLLWTLNHRSLESLTLKDKAGRKGEHSAGVRSDQSPGEASPPQQKAGCLLGLPGPGGEGGEAHGLTGMWQG